MFALRSCFIECHVMCCVWLAFGFEMRSFPHYRRSFCWAKVKIGCPPHLRLYRPGFCDPVVVVRNRITNAESSPGTSLEEGGNEERAMGREEVGGSIGPSTGKAWKVTALFPFYRRKQTFGTLGRS